MSDNTRNTWLYSITKKEIVINTYIGTILSELYYVRVYFTKNGKIIYFSAFRQPEIGWLIITINVETR